MRSVFIRRRLVAVALVAAVVAVALIALPPGSSPQAPASSPASPTGGAAPVPARGDPAAANRGGGSGGATSPASIAGRLTIRQLAGQRVIFAYQGLRPPRSLYSAIRAGEVGGIIFFSSNIGDVGRFRTVVHRLQRASLRSPLHDRLLMLTDQEGGDVRRLPGAPARSEKQIGASSRAPALAAGAGRAAGRNLAHAGINVNLAPVLDVFRTSGNFIDSFGRSYSSDPSVAGRLGARFISAQQALGVAATAKHFPGLGAAATAQNTDLRPVVLHIPLTQLRAVDEAPYRRAIAAGVRLVMTSWAVYPALVPRIPAGLSSAIVDGELRRRLGFRGVTITDALGAGALVRYGDIRNRAVLAAEAGNDLILGTSPGADSPRQDVAAVHALAAAIADHRISLSEARRSVARILALPRPRFAAPRP
ncbi:MAG: glycoside hydrolase family 3 N-terminal domain-containing protein [Solirubrobacteraceae bacterium]